MSDSGGGPGKPGAKVSWETITRVADEAEREEMERLLAASDEELDAELKEAGFAPDDAANLVKAALAKAATAKAATAATAPGKVLSLDAARQKRGRSPAWLALVAAAAAVAVFGGGGVAYVALRAPEPGPTTPVPTVPSAPPTAPPEMLAKRDADAKRALAAQECGAKKWAACLDDLEHAAKLDPAGEGSAARRMRGKADRGVAADEQEAKPGELSRRSMLPEEGARLVTALAPRAGQPVRVVCAREAEAERYCGQIAAAMAKAGWVVTREAIARDAGGVHGVAVTVTAGADDATEDAAEALAEGLARAYVKVEGPDDVPAVAAGGSAGPAMTLTVGER